MNLGVRRGLAIFGGIFAGIGLGGGLSAGINLLDVGGQALPTGVPLVLAGIGFGLGIGLMTAAFVREDR